MTDPREPRRSDERDERLLAAIDLHLAARDCEAGLVPPAELRERVLSTPSRESARPAASHDPTVQVWKNWRADRAADGAAQLSTVRRTEGGWEGSAIPGIRTRRLAVDTERRAVTMMISMAPGSSYPAHRHAGSEECYVISGDLRVGDDQVLGPGDFQFAEAGSVHAVQSTVDGCTLLLTSSQDDELLGV